MFISLVKYVPKKAKETTFTEKNVQVGQCSCLLLNIPKQAKETQLLQSYYYKQAALCETQAGGSQGIKVIKVRISKILTITTTQQSAIKDQHLFSFIFVVLIPEG